VGTTTVEELVVAVSAQDQLTATLQSMQSSFEKFGGQVQSLASKWDEAMAPAGKAAGAVSGIFQSLTTKVLTFADSLINAPVEAAIAFEGAMAKLGSITHTTGDALGQLRARLEDTAVASGESAAALATVASSAAKLGLRGADLTQFTETAAQFAAITGESSAEAAQTFTTLRSVFRDSLGDSQQALMQLASGFTALQDVSAASASQIAEAVSRVGSAATLGIKPGTVAAMVAEFANLGVAAESVGPSINEMLANMGRNIDKAGQLVGITGKAFKTALETDANQALLSVLQSLGKMTSGVDRLTTAQAIFGEESGRQVVQLAGHYKDFEAVLKTSSDATERGTALAEKFKMVSETLTNILKRMKEAFLQVGVEIGSVFLPSIDAGARAMLSFGVHLRDAIKNSKEVVGVLTATGLAMSALGAAKGFQAGSLTAGLTVIKSLFIDITPMIVNFGSALTSTGSLASAAAAGFSTLAAVAVPLAELYLLVKLIPKALEGWKIILDNVVYGFELLTEKVKNMIGAVGGGTGIMSNLGAIANRILDGITAGLAAVGAALGKLAEMALTFASHVVRQLEKIPGLSRAIPEGLSQGLLDAGQQATAQGKLIGTTFGVAFKGALVDLGRDVKDFFSGMTAESVDIAAGKAELSASLTTISATSQSYVRLRQTVRELAGAIRLSDEQLIESTRTLGKNGSAWKELGLLMRAGVPYAEAVKIAQTDLADSAAYATDKQRLLKAGLGDSAESLAKMSPVLASVSNAFKMSGEAIDTGAAAALVRLYAQQKAGLNGLNELKVKIGNLTEATSMVTDARKEELAGLLKQQTAAQSAADAIEKQVSAVEKASGASKRLRDTLYDMTPAATAAVTAHKTVGTAVKSSGDQQKDAFDRTKFAFESWAKSYELKSKFVTDMAKITEEQITGSMKAIEGSLTAVSGSITGTAPVLKDLMDPTRPFSMMGNDITNRILGQFQLQAELVEQQKQLNQENLENLRQKRALTAAGVAQSFRIKVDGTDPAMTSLVREVTERLMLQASREGGELCCG